MKIKIITTWWPEVAEKVKEDPELAKIIKPGDISYTFDANSEIFDRFLNVANGTRGCTINPVMEFDKNEVRESKYYQLQARGNLILETTSDETLNKTEIVNTPLITTDAQTEVCLVEKVFISKLKVKPSMISTMHWSGMFVMDSAVFDSFSNAGLTGYSVKPVINPKCNERYQTCGMLFSRNILPKAETDISMFRRESCFNRLGCLTYDTKILDLALDFNRTAENFNTFNFPGWIVSSSAKLCYEDHKLKGWHFQPVLEKGSIMHHIYLEKWGSLFFKLKNHEKVKMLGFN